ncbi:hypothetical protein [Yoonia sp. 208BN28-4]|uniref:hypothetical protein n=1 Tax=Yoonia sp. 208BN28-4 TaxID=3126505 RepID=UPI0030AA994A
MKIELRSIIGAGNLSIERVTLRIVADLDIGDYMLAQSFMFDEQPSTNLQNCFWFPFKEVSKGDLIVLYSKEGTQREKPLSTGANAHFFYLDLKQPIWDDSDMGAVIIETPDWVSKPSQDLLKRT